LGALDVSSRKQTQAETNHAAMTMRRGRQARR
jgi:hypothetical protein